MSDSEVAKAGSFLRGKIAGLGGLLRCEVAKRGGSRRSELAKVGGHLLSLSVTLVVVMTGGAAAQNDPFSVVYEGSSGPGAGKQVVLIAGDHEYRSEEILPAMARILARRFGFACRVFFTLDEEGFIEPGSSNVAGLEALRDADLLVLGLRFQDFPDEQMQHIVDYLARGGPVLGIRTSTHAFNIPDGPFRKYTWDYEGSDYEGGFGRQVLGETWVGHNGTNHEQSTRIRAVVAQSDHPILRGVEDAHVASGGYQAYPVADAVILATAQPLDGMAAGAAPAAERSAMPAAWTRAYAVDDGPSGRVFTTTHGASEDFLDESFRRMLINAALWAVGVDEAITADLDVALVGPYYPAGFAFDGYRRGVRPSDLAGWDTPIMDPEKPTSGGQLRHAAGARR